jgi:hypothetical protein
MWLIVIVVVNKMEMSNGTGNGDAITFLVFIIRL